MRVAFILVVIVGLFASSQAIDLSGLAELGKNLVGSLIEKGKELVKNGLANLLSKFGKRELPDAWKGALEKLGELLNKGKEVAAGVFGKAVGKLKELVGKFHEKLGMLKSAQAYADEVDDVVAEHHVQQKRILGEIFGALKGLAADAIERVKGFGATLKEKASDVASALLQKGADLFLGKRATLSDHLKTIGGAISGALSPFKDIVASLGNTLKGHFSNLVEKVKGHVTALKGKLAGHVSDLATHGKTLLEHGKNAVGALSEVVKDILKQTLSNAKPAIDGLAKTAINAGKTVVDHFAGSNQA